MRLHGDDRSGCTLSIRRYPQPRMKLALGPVTLLAATLCTLSVLTGCASAPAAAPVSTASLTSAPVASSAIVAPSSLAPAAWEDDELTPAATSAHSPPSAPAP